MGFLTAIFGGKPKPPGRKRDDPVDINFDDHEFVTILALDFFGQSSKSPDGRWAICWLDGNSAMSGTALGRYLLVDVINRRVVLDGNLERPNNGHVANSGAFCLEDWQFYDSGLHGRFVAIDPSGQTLISQDVAANLYDNAISEHGHLAACQTANAPGEDGNSLFLFDLNARRQLFHVHPRSARANHYAFDESNREMTVVLDGLGRFRYDEHGVFLDGEKYDQACATGEQVDVVLGIAQSILAEVDPPPARVTLALQAATRAVELSRGPQLQWKAASCKAKGMVHELLGDARSAMASYEAAVEADPKIGVKRRLQSLKRRLGLQP